MTAALRTAKGALTRAVNMALEAGMTDTQISAHVAGVWAGMSFDFDRLVDDTEERHQAGLALESLLESTADPDDWSIADVQRAHAALENIMGRPRLVEPTPPKGEDNG